LYFDVERVKIEPNSGSRAKIVDIIRKFDDMTIEEDTSKKRLRME
jgi:hypothetical protein